MRQARNTVSRREKLLVAIVNTCQVAVRDGQPTTWGELGRVMRFRRTRNLYPPGEDRDYYDRLQNDLEALAHAGYIKFDMYTGNQGNLGRPIIGRWETWHIGPTDEGIDAAVDYEKNPIRREFEKWPATYILAIVSLFSLVVALAAFFKNGSP